MPSCQVDELIAAGCWNCTCRDSSIVERSAGVKLGGYGALSQTEKIWWAGFWIMPQSRNPTHVEVWPTALIGPWFWVFMGKFGLKDYFPWNHNMAMPKRHLPQELHQRVRQAYLSLICTWLLIVSCLPLSLAVGILLDPWFLHLTVWTHQSG